ncbi:MAG: diaminopimelate epimerase [Thermodesulfobacteriota bacterium]|nr:diaminopimelate epimerase [Thermodesulfobacteriota bacterium]
MRETPFFKMSGSGNDFILIDNRQGILDADRLGDFVRRVCARKVSVGADGLILVESSNRVNFRWRFFNSDGSEAEMCGNGGRCAARFAVIKGIAPSRLSFETLAGIIEAEVNGRQVKLQMVQPTGLKLNLDVPIDGQNHQLYFINTGVPHAIKMVEDAAAVAVKDLGRKIRFHAQFQPAGTNANFVQPVNRKHLKVRTYERGVEDETLACGTGAVASALIAAAKGLVDSPVMVETTGGEILNIYFQSKGDGYERVFLEGDTKVVYEGSLWEEAYQ